MRSGRIFTIFSVDCRFGLPVRKPFFLHASGQRAAVILLREFAPLEFVDPSNSLDPAWESEDKPGFRLAKPVAIPETDKVYVQWIGMVPTDINLKSPDSLRAAMAEARVLVVFEPLGNAASLRSCLSTEIAIAVECTQAEWEALPKGKFDERHAEVWDEFVRTYHMVTADVRPPFWNDGHRLMVVKQGWIPYEQEAEQLLSF